MKLSRARKSRKTFLSSRPRDNVSLQVSFLLSTFKKRSYINQAIHQLWKNCVASKGFILRRICMFAQKLFYLSENYFHNLILLKYLTIPKMPEKEKKNMILVRAAIHCKSKIWDLRCVEREVICVFGFNSLFKN